MHNKKAFSNEEAFSEGVLSLYISYLNVHMYGLQICAHVSK